MTRQEQLEETMRAVVKALDVPRNRMGKLVSDVAKGTDLRELVMRYKLPGGIDEVDQAVRLMRAVLNEQ